MSGHPRETWVPILFLGVIIVRMKTKLLAVIIMAAVLLTGCPSFAQILPYLELGAQAASILVPMIGPQAHLPADLQAKIIAYDQAAAQCFASASDITSGTGTDASKALSITSACASAAAPAIPAQYADIATTVGSVAQQIAKILSSLPPAAPQSLVRAKGTEPAPGRSTRITDAQRQRLAAVKAKSAATLKAWGR
jgi:hypothetical protein